MEINANSIDFDHWTLLGIYLRSLSKAVCMNRKYNYVPMLSLRSYFFIIKENTLVCTRKPGEIIPKTGQ